MISNWKLLLNSIQGPKLSLERELKKADRESLHR